MKIIQFKVPALKLKGMHIEWLNLAFIMVLFQLSGFAQKESSIYCPSLFSDHMVIQQGIQPTVWGSAKNTDKVVIEFSGTKTEALVSKSDGSWIARLPVFTAGGPFEMKVKALGTKDSILFHDVMVGEVWVASGQSNMQFSVPGVKNSADEIKNAKYPDIRFLRIDYNMCSHPLNSMKGSWKEVNPENVKELSAVAYFFARQLHCEKKVAVGMLVSAWGGTPIEAWISADMLSVLPELRENIRHNMQQSSDWTKLYRNYLKQDSSLRHSAEGERGGVHQLKYKMDGWKKTEMPLNTENIQLRSDYFGGFIWLRKPFNLTEIKSSCKLYTKNVIGELEVYINGEKLTNPIEGNHVKVYSIPKHVLRKGENMMAFKHLSFWVFGKLIGEQKKRHLFGSE